MNTLILKSDRDSFEKYYLKKMNEGDIVAVAYYRPLNEFLRYLSVLHMQKLRFPGGSVWYGTWKYQLKRFDNIILFDRNYNWNIIKYIHRNNPACRIIVWYWNPLDKIQRVPERYRRYCEEWSFNLYDCNRYGLNYNVQFSFWDINKTGRSDIMYDAYFVGKDKGRSELLMQIKDAFEAIGRTVRFIIIKDNTSNRKEKNFSEPISYEENLENISSSRCVIEIAQKNQTGLTVRCLEALFNGKKIITNNTELFSYNFYNPTSIFILQSNKISKDKIETFLNIKTEIIDKKILNKYDYHSWLQNFNIKK